jgi:S1-C subfamily serine protease
LVRLDSGATDMRLASVLKLERAKDLALLKFEGRPVRALPLATPNAAKEGMSIAVIGFPLGGALGFSPVSHRGIISSITPIALPMATAQRLNEKSIRQIREGTFDILQLDATAYPGNSGGPVFSVDSGEVVGVINMVLVKGSKESALSHPSGISYAIPVGFVRELLSSPEN